MKEQKGTASVILCLCEVVVGILLFVNPVGFTAGIIIALGAVLIVAGVVNVVNYFRQDPAEAALGSRLAAGLASILAGLFCVTHSHWFIVTFPLLTILYGVVILVSGLVKAQWAVDLARQKLRHWCWMALSAALTLIFAAIILLNPFATTAVLWIFVAISLIVEAVADLVTAIFGRQAKKSA